LRLFVRDDAIGETAGGECKGLADVLGFELTYSRQRAPVGNGISS
jgi:hypothetical protein